MRFLCLTTGYLRAKILEEKTKQEQQRLTPSIGEGVHNVQSRYEYVIVCGCFAASALCIWGCFIIGKLDHQLNEDIRDKEVRLIAADGTMVGIVTSEAALKMAEEQELDLVKISPNAVPPVCKIMDYGKFRFDQLKKEKEARKNQHVVEIKEIRMSPGIDTNDLNTKMRSAVKFLKDGNRVKVTVRFRGREMAHTDIGEELLIRFGEGCAEVANMEKKPKLDGRHMSIFLSPKSAK